MIEKRKRDREFVMYALFFHLLFGGYSQWPKCKATYDNIFTCTHTSE